MRFSQIQSIINKQVVVVVALFSIFIGGCNDDNSTNQSNNIESQINAFPKEELNENEIASLLFMREEEKLAKDVYITLYKKWGVNIFDNISLSEATHTNAVLTILNKYNLPDPVNNNIVGVFKDTTLQNLYNILVETGSKSALDGYKVGATIEELDIFDLKNWTAKVDNQDINFVYQNLTKGSRNHLRSFYSLIISNGSSFTPAYLTQEEFDAIINSPKETGSW